MFVIGQCVLHCLQPRCYRQKAVGIADIQIGVRQLYLQASDLFFQSGNLAGECLQGVLL